MGTAVIVRPCPDDTYLLDIAAAHAHCSRRPVRTIRKHCEPAACDVRTRVLLYNTADLTPLLTLPRRKPRGCLTPHAYAVTLCLNRHS